MQMNKEPYGTGASMDSVYYELNQLQSRFCDCLEEESLSSRVTLLKSLIEDCRQGDGVAEESLREYGGELLRAIKEKLEAAVAEQERILEESPTVANCSNGKKTHHLSRAVALVADAEKKLDASLDEELPR